MILMERRAWLEFVRVACDRWSIEQCGLLLGRSGIGVRAPVTHAVVDVVMSSDEDNTRDTFTLHVDAWRMAQERVSSGRGLEILGTIHSHTFGKAWPSKWDVGLAQAPEMAGWCHIIFTLHGGSTAAFTYEGERPSWQPMELR